MWMRAAARSSPLEDAADDHGPVLKAADRLPSDPSLFLSVAIGPEKARLGRAFSLDFAVAKRSSPRTPPTIAMENQLREDAGNQSRAWMSIAASIPAV
jgi:hypothetical protein